MNNWDDEDDNSMSMDIDEYVRTLINKSASGRYVLLSFFDNGDMMVIDKGSLDFCVQRMKSIFNMSNPDTIKNGMSILSFEDFIEQADLG